MHRIILISLLIILPLQVWSTNSVFTAADTVSAVHSNILIKPDRSGDNQHQKVNLQLNNPVRVRLLDKDNQPVAAYPVHFKILAQPEGANGFRILNEIVLTDSAGIAVTEVILGSREGIYEIAARIEGSMDKDLQVYTFHTRKSNWLFMLIIGLLGGLGLFLLGMDMMSEGLKKSAGDKMRSILSNLTHNRILALGLGTFITMIVQSSSATSVMLVGFVNSKLIKFKRTIAILLGADIGTTITAQLIAFKLTDYSLLMIALGFALMYMTGNRRYKHLGQSILGFGILFFGMYIMSEAMYPLRSYDPFINILLKLENPIIGILAGTIATAIIQSSGAFIGIMIVLASQGLLTLEAAIPLLLGSNIGTAGTSLIVSIRATTEAKKVAFASLIIKIIGVLLMVWWIPSFADIITHISPGSNLPEGDMQAMAETVPRQIANAHTTFNIFLAALFLPVTNLYARLIDRIIPGKELPEEAMLRTMYLDESMIHIPSLGLNLAKKETLRIGQFTQDMVGDLILPFLLKQPHLIREILNKEKQVDYLSDEIHRYLMRIVREGVEAGRTDEAFQIMYTIKEFEQIADICANMVEQKAEAWIQNDIEFSAEGKKELLEYHMKTQKQLARAIEVFRDVNLEKAKKMKAKHRKYRGIAIELEKSHYERLLDIKKKVEASGDTHMELITQMRIITSHSTNIARILLEWTSKSNTVTNR